MEMDVEEIITAGKIPIELKFHIQVHIQVQVILQNQFQAHFKNILKRHGLELAYFIRRMNYKQKRDITAVRFSLEYTLSFKIS